jgi:cytochrome c556
MRRTFVMLAALAFSVSVVYAASDAIIKRQALMKANHKAVDLLIPMLKGGPFDLATTQAALKTFIDTADKAPALFPDDSKTGNETNALPAIWQNKKDFEERFAKLGVDAKAALGATKDAASFKATMPKVLDNCDGCHEHYRAELK